MHTCSLMTSRPLVPALLSESSKSISKCTAAMFSGILMNTSRLLYRKPNSPLRHPFPARNQPFPQSLETSALTYNTPLSVFSKYFLSSILSFIQSFEFFFFESSPLSHPNVPTLKIKSNMASLTQWFLTPWSYLVTFFSTSSCFHSSFHVSA